MEGISGPDFHTQSSLRAVTEMEGNLARLLERYAPPVEFQSFAEFTSVVEESAEPVMGTATETILPANGLLLMYGDGGAGKTTLSVDASAHLGSGTSWLGLEISRPMRVLLIENEGPRGKFRQMLAEKADSWSGEPFTHNLTVLEEPWTQFTLQEDTHRAALAEHVDEHEIDVVFMGPLVTLGMVGGGTPDEVSAFEALVGQTRSECSKPFALWIVHHENKAGDVSGAWERVPDTLCHIQAQGNGHTRLHWRKARWSSESHGTSLDLVWREGRSFSVREDEAIDHHAELLGALGDEWLTYKEAAKLIGRKETPTKEALSDLVRRGDVEFQKGPPGRHQNARCYRLSSAPKLAAHTGEHSPLEGMEEASAPLRPPYRETVGSSADDTYLTTSPDELGADVGEDDEIPF